MLDFNFILFHFIFCERDSFTIHSSYHADIDLLIFSTNVRSAGNH